MPKHPKKQQPVQPAQATTQTQQTQQTQVPLVNVGNLGYPDDAYLNVCETSALIEAYSADYGLTEKVDLNKINRSLDLVDQHEKKLEDHQTEIESLKKRLDSVEAAQAQQPAQAQATQQPVQPVQTQATQAQLTPFGNGVTIEQLYRSGDVVAFDKDDAIQTAGGNGPEPVKVRCFVNNLKQAAQLTPEQMVVCGFSHIVTKV